MTRAALLLCAVLVGCPSPVAFVTRHSIEVAKPAPPPDAATVEAWGDDPHHRLMCSCGLPVGAAVCERLGVETR